MLCVMLMCVLASCGHEHEWTDATCTAPKTCTECSATEGTALGHSYSDGICEVCGNEDPAFVAKYDEAISLIDSRDYDAAYALIVELGNYKDAQQKLDNFHYVPVASDVLSNGEISKGECFYSVDNLPIQFINTKSDGVKEIVDYTYDANGNPIKVVFTDDDGDKDIYDYTYDANGNLIKEVHTYSDGDKSIYDYTYDANGNLIKEVYTSFTGNKSIYDYTYDANGNKIKGVCTYSDGDSRSFEVEYKLVYLPQGMSEQVKEILEFS